MTTASKFRCCAAASEVDPNTNSAGLGRSAAAFALAAAITVLFNTALAWAKDLYPRLNDLMGRAAGHNWAAQGVADLLLFAGLGLVFQKTGWAERIAPQKLIAILACAVIVAGAGLVVWYAIF